ncbi:MAG: cysteine hydrolase [Firmicutes bacterium]|nr:cysteine hydrolase [Bacillota bacterium]
MKKLLVVVDYQKDFVDGALGFAGAELLDDVIAAKVQAYLAAGDDVMLTLDTHGEDYLQTQEGKNLPVPHCLRESEGWRVYGQTGRLLEDCRAFEKPVFGSAQLFDYLRGCNYQQIELCGLVSNICVLSNAILAKTAQPEAEIIVDAKATASFDPLLHEQTLSVLGGLQVSVINK